LKLNIFIFILAMLAAGSVVAEENSVSSSRTSATAGTVSITDQAHQIADRAIDERVIDRFVSFDPSDGGGSDRYSVSFDLENEASEWSFQVTVTMEF
jgi:hypothetical protein